MKQNQNKRDYEHFTSQIKSHIEETFTKYNVEVEKRNQEQIGGILHKNDKSEKIYSSLQDVARELKHVQKELQGCQKLRRERRELFNGKTTRFLNTLNHLTRQKGIRIKINAHLERLVDRTKQNVSDVMAALRKFQTESVALCGKAYDYKTMVEQVFVELAEMSFIWQNISNFESVTNQSVKEIFLPIGYHKKDAQRLEIQLSKVWNDMMSRIEPPPPRVAPPSVQTKIIKSDLQLAHEYLFGFTRSQEINKAIEIYQKEANKANPDPTVFNALGMLHEQGKGFQKDVGKAFRYFMKSAEKGDPEGLYRVGQYLQKGILNFKQYFDGLYANRDAEVRGGIEYFEKAAAKGHLDALTDLGFIYQKGVIHDSGMEYFIEPHPDHAKKYYQKAKEKQFPRSYNNLGNLLICENTVTSNLEENANLQKGIKYLNKARELGCAKASLSLGKCYMSGTGFPVNLQKARSLFKEAAQMGEVQGRLEYLRSYIGTNLDEEQTMNELVDTVRTVLVENRKNPEALYIMGLLQEKGIGVPASKEASFHYVASAARLDYPPALTRLGDYYYSGHHVDKHYQNARILYQKAAQKNDSQAYLNLALMQQKGLIPMGISLGSTAQLYEKAEELGNTNVLLIKGLKKPQDISKNSHIIRAAQRGNSSALKMLSLNDTKPMSSYLNTSQPQMKKLQTFYMKQSFPSKMKFTSQI